MTKITVKYKNDEIVSISAIGHADFGNHGFDIVCAAVSTLMATAVNSLTTVAGLKYFIFESDEETADMYIELPSNLTEIQNLKSQVILKTVEVGLNGIANSYPENIKLYVKGGANIQ